MNGTCSRHGGDKKCTENVCREISREDLKFSKCTFYLIS
jgi:hypothetical protein